METRKKRGSGFIFYLILIAIIFVIIFAVREAASKTDDYTYGEFVSDLNDGLVSEVVIGQNKEVPTGVISVKLENGKSKTAYVTDVKEVEGCINAYNSAGDENDYVPYTLGDVERDSVFLTTVLPFLIVGFIIIFLFIFMTRGSSGGGANLSLIHI